MPTTIEPIPDSWAQPSCSHPDHNPPMHVAIPGGHRLKHTCPGCGKVSIVESPVIVCEAGKSLLQE